jgi:hypothetical protein
MIFLVSPDLGDTKEQWMEWLSLLGTMNQHDISVKFAVSRAKRIMQEMDKVDRRLVIDAPLCKGTAE